MDLSDFISDALLQPPTHITYYVSRRLAELRPGKAIVEGENHSFDLPAFAHADQGSAVTQSSVHVQNSTVWVGSGNPHRRDTENGWFNVLWRGHFIDVIYLKWSDCDYRHWIVAESQEIADAFLAAVCDWCSTVRGEILVFDGGYWQKNEQLFHAIRGASLENLVLPAQLKLELGNDLGQFFDSREIYERYGIPWRRGVLLIGPPGNGKTHAVKALINELKRPCLYVKSFKSRYGTDHDNMREVFARARINAPCLLVFEDLDSMIDNKNKAFLLNELDGFASNAGVAVLATTNHPERLDPAILDRPSRFDRKYLFDLPGVDERRAFIASKNESLQDELRLTEEGVRRAAEETDGFSFAFLKELFVSSMTQWMAAGGLAAMDAIAIERARALKTQMASPLAESEPVEEAADDDDDQDP
jgi:ATPase family associated with various cellular activities (AAA)